MEWVNLTPHSVRIVRVGKRSLLIQPSGKVARVQMEKVLCTCIGGIEIFETIKKFENIQVILDNPDKNYIVSNTVLHAYKSKHRHPYNMFAPGKILHHTTTREPIACCGLVR